MNYTSIEASFKKKKKKEGKGKKSSKNLNLLFPSFFLFCFETGSHYVAQPGP
jgi:hypothetical protein